MRMGMLLRSFTSFVSEQSDFDLRASDQTAVGRGMLWRDKFLWNFFKLADGHNNLISVATAHDRDDGTYSCRVSVPAPYNATTAIAAMNPQ